MLKKFEVRKFERLVLTAVKLPLNLPLKHENSLPRGIGLVYIYLFISFNLLCTIIK